MARKSVSPWWNGQKQRWFVWHDGRQVNLLTDCEREALRRWHRLMGGVQEEPVPLIPKATTPKATTLTVKQLADDFLRDAEGRMTPRCRKNYVLFLNALTLDHGRTEAEILTPEAVEAVSRKPSWSSTHRANFLGAVVTVYRWGMKGKRVTLNPVDGVRKPQKASRGSEAIISREDHERLLAYAKPVFAAFLRLLWMTGCRPGELTSITVEMVRKMANGVMPLTHHKNAHKGKTRALILNPEAVGILKRRAEGCEGERLFPWKETQVANRMNSLRKRAGVSTAICYGYRHTFGTDLLASGVPDSIVAALLGHCDTSMIHRHYSHLSSRTQTLRDALGKVRG